MPTTTLAPSPATPSPAPAATPYPVADKVVQVVVTDLVVRTAPGLGGGSSVLPRRLSVPQLLFLFEGPAVADGYTWYRAMPFSLGRQDSLEDMGWVAVASRDDEPWVTPVAPECPAPTIETVSSQGTANLACYAGQTLVLEGTSTSCGAYDPMNLRPAWMTPSCYLAVDSGPMFWMAAGSGFEQLDGGVRVEGHFDDSAAQTCSLLPSDPGDEGPDAAETIFFCRTTFVADRVTSLEPS